MNIPFISRKPEPPTQQPPPGEPIYDDAPNPAMGEPPSPNLEIERWLAEHETFRTIKDTDTKEEILKGDLPYGVKRNMYAIVGKQVINANLSETDLRVRDLDILLTKLKAKMFTPAGELNREHGRGVWDIDQAAIFGRDLATQAKDGMHSKQRTTITQISMAGRLEPQQVKTPKEGGSWY